MIPMYMMMNLEFVGVVVRVGQTLAQHAAENVILQTRGHHLERLANELHAQRYSLVREFR